MIDTVGPPGFRKLLAMLVSIQRSAASGTLLTGGPGGGVLVFEKGSLIRVRREGRDASPPMASASEIQVGLREEARRILAEECRSEGNPAFVTSQANAARAAKISSPLNAGDLVVDLARAVADPIRTRQALGKCPPLGPNPSPPAVAPRVSLGPSEGYLLSRADSSLSFDEIMALSPIDENETPGVLFGLLAAGLLSSPGVDALGEIPALPAFQSAPAPAASEPGPAPEPGAAPPKPATKASDLDSFLRRTGTSAQPPTSGQARPIAPSAGSRASKESPGARRPSIAGSTPPAKVGAKRGAGGMDPAARCARIEERVAAVRGADHYGVLGVERTADEETIRRAYYKLAKEFHPDKLRGSEFESLLGAIETMFSKMTEAYNTLSEEKARAEYDRDHQAATGAGRPHEFDTPAQAKESYLRARKHLEGGELFDALRLLETACELDATKSEYWYYLGIVQTKNPKWRKKAEESLLKAIELNSTSVPAYQQLARLYKGGGLVRRSHEMYEKLLQWEPENEEALVELGRKSPSKKGGKDSAKSLRSLFKGSKS